MNRSTSFVLFLLLAAACGGPNTVVETSGERSPSDSEAADDDATRGEAGASPTTPAGAVANSAPATTCENAEPIPPCGDEVDTTVSADDLVNQWDSLEGQTVHVLGPLRLDEGMCTEQYCPPEDPCCNSCDGQLTVASDLILDDPAGRFSCQGTGCGLCCGYEVSNQVVRTSGRLGVDQHGYRHLFDAVTCVPSGS